MSDTETTSQALIIRPQVLPSTSQFAMMRELAERLAYAEGFLPKHFFLGDPQTRKHRILAAIEYGRAVGIEPMIALQNITMIDGKAGASALLIGALLRRGGYDVSAEYTANADTCTVTISKAGRVTGRGVFSMENARRAGLVRDGSGWVKYPRDMLYARALTQAARQGAQDAVLGMAYTSEELGVADVDEDGQATGEIPISKASPETVAAMSGVSEAAGSPPAAAIQPTPPAPSVEVSPAATAAGADERSTAPSRIRNDDQDAVAETPPPPQAPMPVMPLAGPSVTRRMGNRAIGPAPRRTNVVTVEQQAPTMTETGAEPASAPVTSPESGSGQPAPSALTDEVAVAEPVDEGQAQYLRDQRAILRSSAATWHRLNVIAKNHLQHALKGEPLETVPPLEPNQDSDDGLSNLIAATYSGQTLDSLGETELASLLERADSFIAKRRDQLKQHNVSEE